MPGVWRCNKEASIARKELTNQEDPGKKEDRREPNNVEVSKSFKDSSFYPERDGKSLENYEE